MERPVADQVTDVGRDPVLTGLDELVVVELFDAFLERLEFVRKHADQCPQRPALLDVTDALDRGQ